MYSRKKALWHLGLTAACLLVADYLPLWNKLWFVTETGNYNTSPFLTALLLLGLYRHWRPARGLLLVLSVLHFGLLYWVLFLRPGTELPTLGYYLTGALHLVAMGFLCLSVDLNRYVHDRPLTPAHS